MNDPDDIQHEVKDRRYCSILAQREAEAELSDDSDAYRLFGLDSDDDEQLEVDGAGGGEPAGDELEDELEVDGAHFNRTTHALQMRAATSNRKRENEKQQTCT